jgi:hypothetical protein
VNSTGRAAIGPSKSDCLVVIEPYETRLETARRRVAEQERLVAVWRGTNSGLTKEGQSTELAEKMLQLMERTLARFSSRPRQTHELGTTQKGATPSRRKGSGATFASARQPHASRRSAPFRGAQRQTWKPAHGHRTFTAQRFRFHFRARSTPSGYRKAASFLVCPLLHKPTPTGHARRSFPATSNRGPESLSGREDSCFLHHRLSGYAHAVWEGARWLGVWDARPGSAQRSSVGVGAVRRIRTAPIHQSNICTEKNPADVDGATGY